MIEQTQSGKARDMLVACHKRKCGTNLRAIPAVIMRSYSAIHRRPIGPELGDPFLDKPETFQDVVNHTHRTADPSVAYRQHGRKIQPGTDDQDS